MPEISIIVPVYNVEGYLAECLDSILAQTVKDIEIILVNDGSTDSSAEICKKYAAKDSRIHYMEKENGGLSSARNLGLTVVRGEYIGFVDSDDIIVDNMFQTLLGIAQDTQADIVCCDYFEFSDKSDLILSSVEDSQEMLAYSGDEAISKMLYPHYFKCFAWNKLFRANLFSEIRFPEGKLFEDIYTSFCLFSKSSKVIYSRQKLYGYRVRVNSISREKYHNRSSELIEAIDNVLDEVPVDSHVYNDVLLGYIFYYMTYINLMIRANINEGVYGIKIRNLIRNNLRSIFASEELEKKRKVQFFLYAGAAPIYRMIIRNVKKCL